MRGGFLAVTTFFALSGFLLTSLLLDLMPDRPESRVVTLSSIAHKQPLRLAEHLDADGAVSETGIEALSSFVASALVVAEDKGCEEMLGFATSAVRDAVNSDDVLATVEKRTGVDISVLSGEDEARLTFLAVRRWFGWSAGRLAVFDIGGGSLEIAGGSDEAPDVAWSVPLGAARLSRQWLTGEPLDDEGWRGLRRHASE